MEKYFKLIKMAMAHNKITKTNTNKNKAKYKEMLKKIYKKM